MSKKKRLVPSVEIPFTDDLLDLPETRYASGKTAAQVAVEATAPGSKVKPMPMPKREDVS